MEKLNPNKKAGTLVRWSEEHIEWLKANYHTMTLKSLATELGASVSMIYKKAKSLGLSKPAGMSPNEKGEYQYTIIKGRDNLRHLCKGDMERIKQIRAKQGRTASEIRRKEERRVLFGLDQRTNMRVVRSPTPKYFLRHKLRKLGYEVAHSGNIAYYTEKTARSEKHEGRCRQFGITIKEKINNEDRTD